MLAAETHAGSSGAAAGCGSSGFQNPTRTFLVALRSFDRGSLSELLIKPATAAQRSVASQKPSYHFPKTHASARCDLTRATRKTQTLRSLAKTMAKDLAVEVAQYEKGLHEVYDTLVKRGGLLTPALRLKAKDATIKFLHDVFV